MPGARRQAVEETGELEAFLRVAEHGSFTAAARELGLTQPGLSRQMQKLERRLDVALFVRTPAGVRLTRAGDRYRAYALEALARRRQMLADLRGHNGDLAGPLHLAASSTPGEFLVPRFVADFTARHPDVRPVVFTADSAEVCAEILERRWDLGFVGARIRRSGVRFDPFAEDEIVLAVPAQHPLADRREVPLEALAGQRFVDREGGSGTLLSVRRALARRGLSLPPHRIGMTLSTTRAIVSAVRAGYGIGFVSSLALAEPPDRRVVGLRLAGLPLTRTLFLVRETRRSLSPVARRFAEFVLDRCRPAAGPQPG
jgi:DNA-binding transcriptional LysR family regulator